MSALRHALCAALLLSLACDEGAQPEAIPAAGSRVVAVAASGRQATENDLCDVLPTKESAPLFAFPALDGAAPPQGPGLRWVNVWATWCPPCVEELPLLGRFRQELEASGTKLELVLVSVDQSQEAVDTFAAQHPEAKASLRAKDLTGLEPWLTSIGLDKGAPLPLHVFVDTQGKVRCARTGAIRESDLPLVKKLLSSL